MSRARNEALINAFAVVLLQARLRREMTQEELSRLAEIDRTYLGLLETSRRQPTLSVISALEQAVGEAPGGLVAKAFALSQETNLGDADRR